MVIYETLKKNDMLNIHGYEIHYEFRKCFFVSQDEKTLTIYDYLNDSNYTLQKNNITEIYKVRN